MWIPVLRWWLLSFCLVVTEIHHCDAFLRWFSMLVSFWNISFPLFILPIWEEEHFSSYSPLWVFTGSFWFRMLFLQVHDFLPSFLRGLSFYGGYSWEGQDWSEGWVVSCWAVYILCFVGVLLSKVNSLGHNFIDALGPYFCLFSSHMNKLVSQ